MWLDVADTEGMPAATLTTLAQGRWKEQTQPGGAWGPGGHWEMTNRKAIIIFAFSGLTEPHLGISAGNRGRAAIPEALQVQSVICHTC